VSHRASASWHEPGWNLSRALRAAVVLALAAWSLISPSAGAAPLPVGGDVKLGDAFIGSVDDGPSQLTITQASDRAVIEWAGFDIAEDHMVVFRQNPNAAVLNIVTGASPSWLDGTLQADGSVYLINPYGITITATGVIDTGGAFAAATLRAANAAAFYDGAHLLEFAAQPGDPPAAVVNEGLITAQDVLLLGSRVVNAGTITANLGRVALGSASRATLDLTGEGFLQVLLPAEAPGYDPLLTNTGTISADGGLVQLKAATVYQAFREAINMPGEVDARSATGREGKIIFDGGPGGLVKVDGAVDASPQPSGGPGGFVDIAGSTVDMYFPNMRLGAGGTFVLTANAIGAKKSLALTTRTRRVSSRA